MLIREVDHKLGLSCKLSLTQEATSFRYLSKLESIFPAFLYMQEDKTYLRTYVSKKTPNINAISSFLPVLRAVEKSECYIIDERINHIGEMKIIDKLVSVNSVVISGIFVAAGALQFRFAFHDNYLDEISDLLSQYTKNQSTTKILDLGPAMGFIDSIKSISSMMPLTVVGYRVPISSDEDLPFETTDEKNLLIEVKSATDSYETFLGVVYSGQDLVGISDKGFTQISKEEHIYQAVLGNPTLFEIRKLSNERKIPRVALFVRVDGHHLAITAFIPSTMLDEYLAVLFSVARKNDPKNVIVTLCRSLNDNLWEQI